MSKSDDAGMHPLSLVVSAAVDAEYATLEKIAEGKLTKAAMIALAKETMDQVDELFTQGVQLLKESGIDVSMIGVDTDDKENSEVVFVDVNGSPEPEA